MDSKWTRLLLGAAAIGALYLAASAGGAAQAGPTANASALTKKQVKKIATKQIKAKAKGLSVEHADFAESADQANNSENLAGRPASAFQRAAEWAVVRADSNGAAVVRGTATGASRTLAGQYVVDFSGNADVRGCAYLATNVDVGSSGVSQPGEISAEGTGGPRSIEVRHYSSAGNTTDYATVDDGFAVAVIC